MSNKRLTSENALTYLYAAILKSVQHVVKVAVYTTKDLSSSHISTADVSHEIPSYLDIDAIIEVCKKEKVTLIHPGHNWADAQNRKLEVY